MILLDREDVDRIGLPQHPFYAEDEEVPAKGPFMLVVHDDGAWAGNHLDDLYLVASKREDPANLQRWQDLADIYADCMGISRQSLVLRYSSMRKQTYRVRGQWLPWEEVYHWPEGNEHAWSALLYGQHPWLEVRDLAYPDNQWWNESRKREQQVRYIP